MRKTWFEYNVRWIRYLMWGVFGGVASYNVEGLASLIAVIAAAVTASTISCFDSCLEQKIAQQK